MRSLLDAQFDKFHKDNPKVYQEILALTTAAYAAGRRRLGMKMLFEVIRWNSTLLTTDPEYKLNNNHTSRYAKMIMENNPQFRDMFLTRER